MLQVPDGEAAKTAEVAANCWSQLGQAGFTRTDVIIGLGGGATTDLAGFIAATWLRGVGVIQVPTTLLAMVDAAVGGKTGINIPEGKNLVGVFHHPLAVLCDIDSLQSMDRDDYVTGMAEVVKCGFIVDPVILDLIEADPEGLKHPTHPDVPELVRRAIEVKAVVVANDFREAMGALGSTALGREVVNYGHTLGHAIERVEHYKWRHGAAISVGMVYVAELSHAQGLLSQDVVDRHRAILSSLGLPISYNNAEWPELLAAMKLDKKARADVLRFVVLEDIAKPAVLEGPKPEILTAAFDKISS